MYQHLVQIAVLGPYLTFSSLPQKSAFVVFVKNVCLKIFVSTNKSYYKFYCIKQILFKY